MEMKEAYTQLILEEAYEKIMGALTMWREGRGESALAKLAIWWVIKNRLALGRWGGSIVEVVTAKWQFSCFNTGDPNSVLFPKPKDWAWAECFEAIERDEPDPTNGATHYFANWIPKPAWAEKMIQTVIIGKHEFYREA